MPTSSLLRRYTLAHSRNHADLLNAISLTYRVGELRPLEAPRPGTMYEFRAISAPQFTVGLISSDVGVRTDRFDGSYYVNLAVSGEVRTQRGDERMVNTVRNAAVFNPGDRQLLAPGPDGVESVGIRLSHELVEDELTALLGHPADGPLRFDFALDFTQPHAHGIRMVVEAMLQQWSSDDDIFRHPAVQHVQVRSFVAGLLLSHRHNFSDGLETGHTPLRPRPLRRALDFVEANLGQHITLADIAAAAGCSARTVTEAFREHLGVTPMTHLRHRRLERVRAELLGGTDSVSAIATRWGFFHLGRFALSYSRFENCRPTHCAGC